MVSKDQSIGGVIFIVCLVAAIFYIATLFYPRWIFDVGLLSRAEHTEGGIRFWLVAIPVFVAFVAIMGIGAWIGWTMATTPPPKPIEEITSEMEEKKEEEKIEEKTEEAPAAEEPPPPPPEAERKPERKRKT